MLTKSKVVMLDRSHARLHKAVVTDPVQNTLFKSPVILVKSIQMSIQLNSVKLKLQALSLELKKMILTWQLYPTHGMGQVAWEKGI